MVNPLRRSLSCPDLRSSLGSTKENFSFAEKILALKSSSIDPTSRGRGEPIEVKLNPQWINPETRLQCKYSPVTVPKGQRPQAQGSMRGVWEDRIAVCKELASGGKESDSWLSFRRSNTIQVKGASPKTVPAIVISGGAAGKIKTELNREAIRETGKQFIESLDSKVVWHPGYNGGEPVYLMVHKDEYDNYKNVLGDELEKFKNLSLVGWDGGELAGFGPARVAATTFADSLEYQPERFMMIDQDVVLTKNTNPALEKVKTSVEEMHARFGKAKPIVAYGVGEPTRFSIEEISAARGGTVVRSEPDSEEIRKFNSPAQQFVSIKTGVRHSSIVGNDGIYPAYMIAGGEDMLMGQILNLTEDDVNAVLRDAQIYKKNLMGNYDATNGGKNSRVKTLEHIYEREKNTELKFEGKNMTLEDLMKEFVSREYIKESDIPNTAACVVERIILRADKELGGNSNRPDGTVFMRNPN